MASAAWAQQAALEARTRELEARLGKEVAPAPTPRPLTAPPEHEADAAAASMGGLRHEYLNVSARDPIIGDVGRRNGPGFGVRYDLGEFAAVKLQYNHLAQRAQRSSNALQLQFAFTF